jgi:hypothetical protein
MVIVNLPSREFGPSYSGTGEAQLVCRRSKRRKIRHDSLAKKWWARFALPTLPWLLAASLPAQAQSHAATATKQHDGQITQNPVQPSAQKYFA